MKNTGKEPDYLEVMSIGITRTECIQIEFWNAHFNRSNVILLYEKDCRFISNMAKLNCMDV